MKKRVPTSALKETSAEQFAAAVRFHADNVRAYHEHVRLINDGDKDRTPYPAPSTLPIIAECVDAETMEPNYEVFDDGPTPDERLRARKTELLGVVTTAEIKANEAVCPPGKRRLLNLRHSDVINAHAAKVKEIIDAALLAAEKSGKPPTIDSDGITKKALAARSKDDAKFVVEHEARARRFEAISRHAAEQQAAVEDLADEAACAAWTMTPFPEG